MNIFLLVDSGDMEIDLVREARDSHLQTGEFSLYVLHSENWQVGRCTLSVSVKCHENSITISVNGFSQTFEAAETNCVVVSHLGQTHGVLQNGARGVPGVFQRLYVNGRPERSSSWSGCRLDVCFAESKFLIACRNPCCVLAWSERLAISHLLYAFKKQQVTRLTGLRDAIRRHCGGEQ